MTAGHEAPKAAHQDAEPAAWQTVPVEPTDAMIRAASNGAGRSTLKDMESPLLIYRDMLAAAPAHFAPEPVAAPQGAVALVQRQAIDDGLWFNARLASEAYLQRALRDLHAAIESAPPPAPQEAVKDHDRALLEQLLHEAGGGEDAHSLRRIARAIAVPPPAPASTPDDRSLVATLREVVEAWDDEKDEQRERWYDALATARAFVATTADRSPAQSARDVIAERQRQISVEGWTPEHDDEHDASQLARAAGCYALAAGSYSMPILWPWAAEWWKPGPPRRMLVKAGALILAEIERLDRMLPDPAAAVQPKEAM